MARNAIIAALWLCPCGADTLQWESDIKPRKCGSCNRRLRHSIGPAEANARLGGQADQAAEGVINAKRK